MTTPSYFGRFEGRDHLYPALSGAPTGQAVEATMANRLENLDKEGTS